MQFCPHIIVEKHEGGEWKMRFVNLKKIMWGCLAFVSTVLSVMGYYPLIPAVYGVYCLDSEHTVLFYIGLFAGMGYFISIPSMCKYLFIIAVISFVIRLYKWKNEKNICLVTSITAAVSTAVMNMSVAAFTAFENVKCVLAVSEGLIVFSAAFVFCRGYEYISTFRFKVREETGGLLPDREEAFRSAVFGLSGIITRANAMTAAENESKLPDTGERISREVTGRLCACCEGCSVCWTSDASVSDSIKMLVEAVCKRMKTEEIVQNRYVKGCPHYARMVEAANEAFARVELNEAWYRRLTENRRIIASQLDAVAQLMDDWGKAEKCIDKRRRLRLSRIYVAAREKGLIVENAHIYETAGHRICIKADVYTKEDGGIEAVKYVQAVSRAMGVQMRQAHETVSIITDELSTVVLYEENRFYALSGVATKKKTGSQANGDSCSMFQLDDGMYHVCVSDGMGSGKQAQAESTLVVDLLEKLLEAGFSRESALKLMNSAMVISAGEESYSTVDFATIDMYTGELELTKTGAAPSFIKSGKGVSVVENESLPAGVDAAQESVHSKNTLQSGDFLVMVTDGVLEYLHVKDRQGKLMDIIAGVKSDNAGVLAQEILDRVLLDTGGYAMDDMTVVAIGIWEK